MISCSQPSCIADVTESKDFFQPAHRFIGETGGVPNLPSATRLLAKSATERGPVASPDWQPPTWEELVREQSPMVFRLAYRLTGNRHDAEDLTQDVFVKVFKSLHTFRPGTMGGWLHRITTNLFLDQARRRSRIRMDPMADHDHTVVSAASTPDETLDEIHLDADVAAALAGLSPDLRVVVVLCDIEGLSYDEISKVLDLKSGTVRSRIHRGRSQLRRSLAHRAPTEGRERYLGVGEKLG